jgi:hypothetical protein
MVFCFDCAGVEFRVLSLLVYHLSLSASYFCDRVLLYVQNGDPPIFVFLG